MKKKPAESTKAIPPPPFPECAKCENHRYTYGVSNMRCICDVREDGSEIEMLVPVKPETHYCSPEIGRYVSIDKKARPLDCPHRLEPQKIKEEKHMLTYVEVKKISPHPDNPRKDLGDLTELAESIKVNGILQNLTIVPNEDLPHGEGYICVIGHRRLAAATLAGVTEVPCSIADMDEHTQIGTMLLENMQRSDLTVYEQAQGFQMMLDLGDTVADIATTTGFSESTVRRRVKLLELDQEKFKESMARGATLAEYAELEQIEDLTVRNKVLEKIGTPNFKWELQRALDNEKNAKGMAALLAIVEEFATKVESSVGLTWIKGYSGSTPGELEKPEDADTAEYFYTASSWGITRYKKRENTEQDNAEAERRKKMQEKNAALDEVSKRARQLRQDFAHSVSNTTAKKHISDIVSYAVLGMIEGYGSLDNEEYADLLGVTVDEDDDEGFLDELSEKIKATPERALFLAAWSDMDIPREKYYNWRAEWEDNDTLNRLYDLLVTLGYEPSDDEKALRDGTHELFESAANDSE